MKTSLLLFFWGPLILSAGPVVYFGENPGLGESTPLTAWPIATAARNQFLATLNGVGTQDFEGFPTNTSAPLALTFPGSVGSLTATLGGNGNVATVSPGQTNGFGRYATSGTNYWESTDVFYIDFGQPIAAFGFYGIDIGDFNGRLTLTLQDGTTETLTVPNTVNGLGGAVLFYGITYTEHPFTRVTFGNTAPGVDFFGFDDMTIGDVQQVIPSTPEPSSFILLGTGLFALAWAIRRRTNQCLTQKQHTC